MKHTLLLLFCLFSLSLQAQERNKGLRYWAVAGTGVGNPGPGLNYSFQLAANWRKHVLTLRSSLQSGQSTFSSIKTLDWPPEKIQEFGITYGWIWERPKYFYSFSVGISYLNGRTQGTLIEEVRTTDTIVRIYEKETYQTQGYPLEIQWFWTPLDYLSLGLMGFMVWNEEEVFGGLHLGVRLCRSKNYDNY